MSAAQFSIVPVIGALPDKMGELEAEAAAENVHNVGRLMKDWADGRERFSKPGECLLSVVADGTLIGIGGLTLEPDKSVHAMRMRRLYVRPAWRRRGAGRALAEDLIARGFRASHLLTLNAGVPGASVFWEALGFMPVHAEGWTHELHATAKRPSAR